MALGNIKDGEKELPAGKYTLIVRIEDEDKNVTNSEFTIEVTAKSTDVEAAKPVIEKIEKLPAEKELKLTDKEAIKAARQSYGSLTDDAKALVENLEKLEALEKAMAKMVKEAIEEKIEEVTLDALKTSADENGNVIVDSKKVAEVTVEGNNINVTVNEKNLLVSTIKDTNLLAGFEEALGNEVKLKAPETLDDLKSEILKAIGVTEDNATKITLGELKSGSVKVKLTGNYDVSKGKVVEGTEGTEIELVVKIAIK